MDEIYLSKGCRAAIVGKYIQWIVQKFHLCFCTRPSQYTEADRIPQPRLLRFPSLCKDHRICFSFYPQTSKIHIKYLYLRKPTQVMGSIICKWAYSKLSSLKQLLFYHSSKSQGAFVSSAFMRLQSGRHWGWGLICRPHWGGSSSKPTCVVVVRPQLRVGS